VYNVLFGNKTDYLLLPVTSSTNDAFNDRSTDLILNRFLLVSSSSDKELVFDVHKVLAVLDDLAISILDRMLCGDIMAPFGGTAGYLTLGVASLGSMLSMRLMLMLTK